jgi:hypothetical protein
VQFRQKEFALEISQMSQVSNESDNNGTLHEDTNLSTEQGPYFEPLKGAVDEDDTILSKDIPEAEEDNEDEEIPSFRSSGKVDNAVVISESSISGTILFIKSVLMKYDESYDFDNFVDIIAVSLSLFFDLGVY